MSESVKVLATPKFRAWLKECQKRGGSRRSPRKTLACQHNSHAPPRPGSPPRGWAGVVEMRRRRQIREAAGLPADAPHHAGPTVKCRRCGNVWLMPPPAVAELARLQGINWTCSVCGHITRCIPLDLARRPPPAA